MNNTLLALTFSCLAFVCGPTACADDSLLPEPVMIDAANGWWQRVLQGNSETLHTIDGGKTWQNVTPDGVKRAIQQQPLDHRSDELFLSNFVDIDPLDARKLWLAAPLAEENRMLVAYTADGGQHWRQGTAPVFDDGVTIHFLDERHGFLLAVGSEELGSVHTKLVGTNDGGRYWHKLTVPFVGYHEPQFSFRTPQDGWCSGNYAQREESGVPFYRTQDGGRTWALQKLPLPRTFAAHRGYSYGTPDAPIFTGSHRQHGTLSVSLHQHVDKPYFDAKVEYHSDDGGKTWRLPVEGVKTVTVD